MWIKAKDGSYYNASNNTTIAVYESRANGWRVTASTSGLQVATLQDGYKDKEEAQAALDELFDGSEFLEIQPPVTEDEISEDEMEEEREVTEDDELVDDEPVVYDYSGFNVEQLREELQNRGLSKSGNREDLIARLEENDNPTK